MRVKGIGRVRARRLFSNGITSPELLAAADPSVIGRIVGGRTAESIIRAAKAVRRGSSRRDITSERMAARDGDEHPENQNVGTPVKKNTGKSDSGAQKSLFSFGENTNE